MYLWGVHVGSLLRLPDHMQRKREAAAERGQGPGASKREAVRGAAPQQRGARGQGPASMRLRVGQHHRRETSLPPDCEVKHVV